MAARLGDDLGVVDAALMAREYDDLFALTGASRKLVPLVATLAARFGRSLPA